MVLEIKYVNANNAVIHTENLVTGILAKISLGTGIWAKFRQGTGIWYPPSRPSTCQSVEMIVQNSVIKSSRFCLVEASVTFSPEPKYQDQRSNHKLKN